MTQRYSYALPHRLHSSYQLIHLQASRLPTHLHFLVSLLSVFIYSHPGSAHIIFVQLTLAQPPSHETIHYADEYQDLLKNPGKAKSGLTWSDILAEEPFEGQHWEGVYGLPRGAVRTDGDQSDVGSSGTSPSLSPWDDEVDGVDDQLSPWETSSEIESQLSTPPPHDPLEDVTNAATERFSRQIALYSHRDEVESLQALQYWRSDWKGHARVDRPFDIGDPSTLRECAIEHLCHYLQVIAQIQRFGEQWTQQLSLERSGSPSTADVLV